jgi:hypothetical protein
MNWPSAAKAHILVEGNMARLKVVPFPVTIKGSGQECVLHTGNATY